MAFYTYDQNNSGGYFSYHKEKGVGEYIIIEADSDTEADERFDAIADGIDDFYEYCSCCGQRWTDYDEKSDVPTVADLPVGEYRFFMDYTVFIHYKDGTITETKVERK